MENSTGYPAIPMTWWRRQNNSDSVPVRIKIEGQNTQKKKRPAKNEPQNETPLETNAHPSGETGLTKSLQYDCALRVSEWMSRTVEKQHAQREVKRRPMLRNLSIDGNGVTQ